MERLAGKRDLAAEIIGIFMTDTEKRVAELQAALTEGDGHKVEAVAHALKGSAANASAGVLKRLAARVEAAARDGQIEEARAIAAAYDEQFQAFREVAGASGLLS